MGILILMKPEPILEFKEMPFFTGVRDNFQDFNLPSYLPFELGVDSRLGMAIQLPNPKTEQALEKAYEQGSLLSTPLGEGTFGQSRLMSLMKPLLELLGDVRGKRLLEIGCGTGAAIEKLMQRGATIIGCDRGPQAQIARKKTGAEIIQERFSSELFTQPFDAIYSFGLLEHIQDVQSFVNKALRCLKPGGIFYAALQNSAPFFEAGDFSHLVHEHWNYFTPESATRLLSFVGLENIGYLELNDCGELCFWGKAPGTGRLQPLSDDSADKLQKTQEEFRVYGNKVRYGLEQMKRFMELFSSQGKSLAFYAGGYSYLNFAKPGQIIRFMDGDKAKYGKYWIPGSSPIESPLNLRVKPVDAVVICAETYADAITRYLISKVCVPETTKIFRLRDISSGKVFTSYEVGVS